MTTAQPTRTARGRIIAVQEQSFRLVGADGCGLLLRLGTSWGLSHSELERLRDAAAEVEVEYEGEPGLASARVRRLRAV